MARDDRLKKVSGAGADFLETARAKAENFVKEVSRSGGQTQGRAQGALDELVGGGRRSTEQFVAAIRKEIQNQLRSLGLATKADLDALERRLSGRTTAAKKTAGSPVAAAATGGGAARSSKSAGSSKTAARKTAARKTTATKSTAAKATATKSTAAKKSAG